MKTILIFAIILVFRNNVHSAKILGVFHATARSHYILGSSLMRALAEKGHDVTVISPFGEKNPPKNGSYRDIVLTGLVEEHDEKIKEINPFSKNKMGILKIVSMMGNMMIKMTESALNHTNVEKLIHSGEKFDVVVVEEFLNPAHKAFATHFGAHLVSLSTMGANSWSNSFVGNPTPLSYVPNLLLGYTNNMTFLQRVLNTMFYVFHEGLNYFYIYPAHHKLIKKYFPNGPDLHDVLYNASIVLLNSHTSTNQPVPYVPKMIDIGGFHVAKPKKLPNELKTFLDNAKNGVIYFSLGSNIKSSLMPVEVRQMLLTTFAKLKEEVLWKWEEDDLPGKPPNVHIKKWVPQQDILAHPNVKLFITHAGLLSTIETIYHGMPVLAIPIGGDQNLNAKQIVNKGFGRAISFQDLTEEALTENINELLTNPSYRQNAKTRSQIFHDRPVTPMETAVYWIEYVIRNGGAPHLRVGALDLPWYRYFLLDVIAFITILSIIVLYIFCQTIKVLVRCCFRKKYQKVKTS
ncbi:UDP-glycosyltransferase UGT5-like [Tribolium madens]|uniref:UDP-glycosyltransferase UGT5-like n=1 Tax=Tribolium madens TaxID=41895 RepID=UPI001CF7664D|nr:UDP-glycosyltransferase UGT5-like [Tribolium madens]